MRDRLIRFLLLGLLLVIAIVVAEPFTDRLLFATPRAVEPRGGLTDLERLTTEIFDRVSPSVVQVAARGDVSDLLATDEEGTSIQAGTGFVWDPAGHVVTNDHVVQGTGPIAVRLATGEVVRAEIVGLAPNYDLAVIRLKNAPQLPPPIAIGTTVDLKVGQLAFAIGNPFGLDQSLTMGVISALKRRLATSDGREISNVIQTDAAINPGNSGGPLLDSSGRLIGVNTAIVSPSGANIGVGFAIPVDIVNRVVPELIRMGRVPTPGIGIIPASEALATHFGIEGVLVEQIVQGSPAERAGLRGFDLTTRTLGDVIVAANDRPVRRVPDLTDQLEQIGVGGTIRLTLKRGSRESSIKLEVIDIGPATPSR